MANLGIRVCNRCRLLKLQDEARQRNMAITLRKSVYGLKPKVPGVDIYIHPKSLEIPSHFKSYHNLNIESTVMAAEFMGPNDPERYLEAWFPAIPSSCECKMS